MGMSETINSPITRRSFLTGSAALGIGVASALALSGPQASAATVNDAVLPNAPKAKSGDKVVVSDLEVMTATPTSITFSWSTFKEPHTDHVIAERVASDCEVWLGRNNTKEPLRCVHKGYSTTGFHYVTVCGLKPNTKYRFECRSFGKKADPGFWFTQVFDEPEVTGVVSTIERPTGKYIQTVAVANDIHIGMSGKSINSTPWPEIMVSSMLAEIKRRGIPHVFINGDLCDHGKLEEAQTLKRLLSAFGEYQKDYYMVRGNHDGFGMPAGPHSFDPIQKVFPQHKLQTCWTMNYGKLRVLGIDSSRTMNNAGVITDKQFQEIERILMQDPNRPTFVMAHHPVTEEAALTNAGQRPFILDKKDSMRLQRLFQKAPGVFFMAAGHTHRAHRDAADLPGGPQFAQFCASTPYPGGFTLMDIYEGGYTVTFHRAATGQALQQIAYNRHKESAGFYGEYTISRMKDRCFTVKRDMSALR